MIERTARCLENGGQIIRRVTKKNLRSRRCLHSAFWSHGAGNINLPSWWIFFLQTSDSNKQHRPTRTAHSPGERVSGAIQELFLDFLYPVQTLALIRRLRHSTVAHKHVSQHLKHCCRNFTSIAEDVITGAKAVESDKAKEPSTTSGVERTVEEIREDIDRILDKEDQRGFYDQLWQSYQDLLEASENLSQSELIKVLRFLANSKRVVDMERLVALFESIPVQQRRAIHYSYAVSAALALKDLEIAIAIHGEALGRIRGSIGTSAILGYTVQHGMWKEAIHVWHPLWAYKWAYFTMPEIWARVDALPLSDLMAKAASAADFAISVTETSSYDAAAAAREFALELIRRSLGRRRMPFDVNKQHVMLEKAMMLDASGALSTMALQQLLSVDSSDHGNKALKWYRTFREDKNFSPTRDLLLDLILKVVSQKRSSDILMVIDDWQTCYGPLPALMTMTITRALAQNGELEATQRLFNDFCSEHGTPKSPDMYFAMLHVYNRRADTAGIVKIWNELQEKYGFEPDVRSWNLIISTFTRVGDLDGALHWFKKLREAKVRPSHRTFSTLMSLYGRKGDRDAVNELYQIAQEEGIKPSKLMIDALVMVNIQDERLEEAERLIVEAVRMPLEGSRNFMWNALLNAYAFRKDVLKVSALHKQMQEAGVASDSMTYAALMTALTILKQPDAAKKIMKKVMPGAKVKHSAIHYAIVMGGYLATKQYDRVFELYKDMLAEDLVPTMSTQNVLLRAAAAVDRTTHDSKTEPGVQTLYARAQQTFDQAMANLDPMELAASEPRKFAGFEPINEAFSSTYFEYMIHLYGTDAAFDKVSTLFDNYLETVPRYTNRDIESSPPIRLLSALIAAHLRDNNYIDIDRCWTLVFDKASNLARKSTASPTTRHDWVLHSRRFILSLPLSLYIKALKAQNRIQDLISTISTIQSSGFELTSPNWNAYIRALTTSHSPAHQTYAFRLCEKELMPYWPGWSFFRDPEYMKNKFRSISRATHLIPQKRMPGYITLVELARSYLVAKRRNGRPSIRDLAEMAPQTVNVINSMPRLEDAPQNMILRAGRVGV